jgi:hypothetical protein
MLDFQNKPAVETYLMKLETGTFGVARYPNGV